MNCLLKQIIEEKVEGGIEMGERQEKRRMQLLDDHKEITGSWSLKEEALYRTVCRTRFGKCNEPVVRQTTEGMRLNMCELTRSPQVNSIYWTDVACWCRRKSGCFRFPLKTHRSGSW
jgi:hypothetical protein